MKPKATKGSIDRGRNCRFLVSALHHQSAQVVAILLQLFERILPEGSTLPDLQDVLRHFALALQMSMTKLTDADEAVYAANAKLAHVRELRDKAVSDMSDNLVRLRRSVTAQYIDPPLDLLGLQSVNEITPDGLYRQAARTMEIFQGENILKILGKPYYENAIDLVPQAAAIVPRVKELAVHMKAFDNVRREVDAAISQRQSLTAEHDALFLRAAQTLESWSRLAGEERLAEKVRPSLRRPGTTAVEPPDLQLEDKTPTAEILTYRAKAPFESTESVRKTA